MNFKTIIAIYKKELKSYFYSATAYVVNVLFLLIIGWFFTATLFINGGEATMRPVYSYVPLLFLFFIPAITMKTIAEEKKSNTFELLVTMPINDIEIILGKFFAALTLVLISVLLTFIYVITLSMFGDVDTGEIIGGYLGLIFMASAYISLGIFASSLTDNQIVAFIIAFIFAFFFFIINKITLFLPVGLSRFFEYISIDYHFSNISKGIIDSRDIIYYLSITVLGLYFANFVLESRKND